MYQFSRRGGRNSSSGRSRNILHRGRTLASGEEENIPLEAPFHTTYHLGKGYPGTWKGKYLDTQDGSLMRN